MTGLGARFDWYSATFAGMEEGQVEGALAIALDGSMSVGRGKMGYAQCVTVERGDDVIARVFSHSATAGEVHVVASGEACDRVVPFLRRMWPEHRVSRADSALDFAADFAALDSIALEFAKERRLAFRLVTDSDGGATRYLGAPSSGVMVRIYKKSEQLRKLHPERAAQVPDGIVRVELQVRPSSKVKGVVASMSAEDVWGLGQWSRDFAAKVLDFDAERVAMHTWSASDWTRTMHWLGRQYAPAIARRAHQVGQAQARAEVLAALGLADGSA